MDADDPIVGMDSGLPMPPLSNEYPKCGACGEPLRPTEEYFHGRAGPCPTHPTLPGIAVTEDRWGFWNTELKAAFVPLEIRDEAEAWELADSNEIPIRLTLTYTVPEGM